MIQYLDQEMTKITILPNYEEINCGSQGGSSGSGIISGNLSMRKLQYACKILTLDAAADIRRYHFLLENISIFAKGEEEVRQILGKRVEFSKDAVNKVKLQM